MKFHCDRCKTRYSIADERVRGKILKIRCKNCSAVITVKEGGTAQEPVTATKPAAVPAPAAAKPAVPRPAVPRPAVLAAGARSGAAAASAPAVKRQQAPAIPSAARAPASAAARAPATAAARAPLASASAKPATALQGAFARAIKRSPEDAPASDSLSAAPAMLEAEWYVSLDGEQMGPYVLTQAQDWVARHEIDDELYCWSEGFDDWLPVEKVSHFRGLRGEGGAPSSARDPFGESDRTMVDAPPDTSSSPSRGLPGPRREDTPVPLFAATMAQMAAEAPTEIDEQPVVPKRSNGAAAASALPRSQAPADDGRRKPALPRPTKDGRSSPQIPSDDLRGKPGVAPRAIPLPANRPAPLPAAKPAPAKPMFVEDPSPSASLEFEIGEASRVVKLPMLGRNLGGAAPAAAPLSSPGLPGLDPMSSLSNSPVGRGTGAFNPIPAAHVTGAGTALPVIQGGGTVEIPRPEIMQPRRGSRSLLLPFAIGGGVLVTAVIILLYVAMSGGDDDEERLARGRVGGDGLAYQFQDADKDGRDDKTGKTAEETAEAAGKAGVTTRRTIKRTGREAGSGSTPTRDPGIGLEETDLSGGGGAFDPELFIEVYRKNQLGVNLCYTSALKRDPFLSVTNAQVFLTVKTDGTISSVSIPALTGTELGGCLTKRIKAWRFPRSSDGGSGVLKVLFKS
jgi:predicted Zn finger-like uncharacterized protein